MKNENTTQSAQNKQNKMIRKNNLVFLLEDRAALTPDKTAFIENSRPVSFHEFYCKVVTAAETMKKNGINENCHILAMVPFSVDLYVTLCAIWMCGACAVMFDPSAGKEHIHACLKEVDVKAMVGRGGASLLRLWDDSLRHISQYFSIRKLTTETRKLTKEMRRQQGAAAIAEVSGDDPALITFTSGSTGIPKAIARSHGFLRNQHKAITACMPYKSDDIDLAVLPVFTLINMVEGITTVMPKDSMKNIAKVNEERLVDQIADCSVSRITLSPRLLDKICRCAQRRGQHLSYLQSVNVGGGPVFLDLLKQAEKSVNPSALKVIYGSTEAEPIAELHYPDLNMQDQEAMKNGSGLLVGQVCEQVSLKIISIHPGPLSALSEKELGQMECPRGEIIVSGPHVVTSYWNTTQNTDTKIQVGNTVWHRTGDCGYLDAGGRLWLLGRTSQVITRNGHEVYPFAVESAIRAKYKTTSAVVSYDDLFCLVVERSTSADSIQSDYQDQFDRVFVVDQIPLDRRHSSKVDYNQLKQLISSL